MTIFTIMKGIIEPLTLHLRKAYIQNQNHGRRKEKRKSSQRRIV